MKKKLIAGALALILSTSVAVGVNQSQAFSLGGTLGSLIKVGGVGYLVDRFGPEIDSFLNKILAQNNLSTTYTTKVVPILTIGSGGYVGAAQVTGPASEIEKVQAVAQIEANFNNTIRVKGLVPVDSMNPTGANRVQGVGVSAMIDLSF